MESRFEQLERVALKAMLVLIAVALMIALQNHLRVLPRQWLPAVSADGLQGRSVWVSALLLGLLFGLIGCPVCGVPLAACVSLRDQSVRYALLTTGLFNLGRLVSFFAIGILAWLGMQTVKTCVGSAGALAAFCAAGFLMIVLGAKLFSTRSTKACAQREGRPVRFSGIGFLLWGVSVGVACGSEALVFVLPAWAATAALSLGGALGVLLVFCLAAFVPITLLVVAATCSVHMLQRVAPPGLFTGLKYAGGVFVMLMGTQFICAGVRGLVQL
ncbi:MAG: hypothetical protein GXP25_02670 [Planctomycetes bacterium]|nr:hypothetical protein [Planctomycetota bacterium]